MTETLTDETLTDLTTALAALEPNPPAPSDLIAALPAPDPVPGHRAAIADVLAGRDPRLLAVVGPCSVHDTGAALEYAELLAGTAARVADDVLVVLRGYLEKPRTVSGWTGLLPDPGMDGGGDVARGVRVGREFLVAAARVLPVAYEFVDPMLAPYVADVVSWGAVGARTVASQPHRHLASALGMPVGMKNCVSGALDTAVAAVRAAGLSHVFPGVGVDGRLSVLRGSGNPDAHLVLRGGISPNYDATSVATALEALRVAGLPERVVVDASHGNSGKDHNRQPAVVADLAGQVAGGNRALVGVMLESYLADGAQALAPGRAVRRDLSVTDACLSWPRTAALLEELAVAARRRRR
ncbi:3-deoxy-7-phosphoheptulonate synthase [Actinosynnema pretiosum subsp. pretiosum]|uniref:Phospho-2-dehydro-3-deoxyheptonate aldolase n=1 Tax=Actinosynnema pretiosum subsp. pretiosum TaxID=103721 RepID=A0AA45L8S0_9PSEU|nr:2-keto-3-deoxy-D-arabino-heptulosonate-7-phosphate synthase I alpha [Actinosynnema pretiosum subsp. pretiosum]QUF05724.1 3-deoxy-7-phosphoheptulonate synthase [Actinosynnema pretiosum subsp. pretiosum]